jgi:ubiquinone/menaquinone biosynthesis C-methylase UbiE
MRPQDDIDRRRQAWSAYWASGPVHSCLCKAMDDPGGEIVDFWRKACSGLPAPTRGLDLGTGNGALAKLLLELHEGDIHVDAVDLAELHPQWGPGEGRGTVSFHPGVGMESLPFPSGAFDLVVSQFGLEYARWPQALDEAARVCNSSGRAAFVMHHAGSLVMRIGRAEHDHQRFLMAVGGVIDAATALLPHLVRISMGISPDAAAEQARHRYNEAMRHLGERISSHEAVDLLVEVREQVHAIVGGRDGTAPAARAGVLERYVEALRYAQLRTSELLACALDESRLVGLAEALRARFPGRDVVARPLLHGGEVVAWGITTA